MQISDHACTRCGCLCDDLRLTVADGRIVKAEGACSLAEPWFLGQDSQPPVAAEVDGQPVTLDFALDRAAAILRSARSPLIFGMSQSGTEGQRAAISLARRIRATIDTPADSHPAILAMQEAGQSTCSLGEVKNRADLVILWGANPAESHPRLFERLQIRAGSVSDGLDQTVAYASRPDRSWKAIPLEEGGDFEILWTLRGLLRGQPIESATIAGVPVSQLNELAQFMKGCRYGVVFFGPSLTKTGLAHRNIEALLRLVDDLNDHTRFHALSLLGTGPRTDEVLTWQTGFPFGVNLATGSPRYNPGEFSARKMLDRGEVDAILVMGGTELCLQELPRRGVRYSEPRGLSSIRIPTATPGIHVSGTAFRMDGVALPLRPVLPARYPGEAEILRQIEERLAQPAGFGVPHPVA